MRQIAFLFAMLAALVSSPALAAPDFPELTGRVVDNADLLSPAQEAELTSKLEALESQSQRQFVVATIPDLQGYDISDYGYQLGREWGIGDAERNDGALLIIAPNERKVRIEVGYGLEPVLTDGLSGLIVQQQILPRFRDGDMAGGIIAGANAVVQQLQLPDEEAQRIAQEANQKRESDGGFPVGALIWIVFILIFFILPMLRGGRRRRRFGGAVGDIILWEVGSAIARGAMNGGNDWGGRSSGGFGGGFGGGGGFSGGGGSFGGGGASGGW